MLQNSPMYAYIPAKDVSRARKFYEEKLGFKPGKELAGGVVYEFGKGTACFLYPTPNAGTSQGEPGVLAGRRHRARGRGAEDARGEVRGLRHAWHEDENGIFTGGGAKAAWFKDSEGNILAVIQEEL